MSCVLDWNLPAFPSHPGATSEAEGRVGACDFILKELAKVSAAKVMDLQLWLCSPVAKQCSCERVHLAELSQLMRLIHVSCTTSSFRNVSALDIYKLGTRSHFPIFSKCQALTDPFSVPFSELGIKILLGLVLAWWNRTTPGQHQGNS